MKNNLENISKRLKITADLLVKVTCSQNYQGRAFEIDNILFWIDRELAMFKDKRKKEKHEQRSKGVAGQDEGNVKHVVGGDASSGDSV